ncbi:MAG: putative bifunctional diguanylate cyclase/phosphodiesterase [Planctomycetota bacterium]
MPPPAEPRPASDAPRQGRISRLWPWILLSAVGVIAFFAITSAQRLHRHAEARHAVLRELAKLELMAKEQSGLVWRALTTMLVEEKLKFVRLRGEEQRRRSAIYELLATVQDQERDAALVAKLVGLTATDAEFAALESATSRFLAGVQGTFGMMSLSMPQIRRRLEFWDMNYGQFDDALAALKERDLALATAATASAESVTKTAALITLLATGLLVFTIGSIRARRSRDLQRIRLRTLKASEARFRELVHNSSDLILVAGSDGDVRYATPSADVLSKALRRETDPAATCDLDAIEAEAQREIEAATALASERAAEEIDAAIQNGSFEEAGAVADASRAAIERAFGLDVDQLVRRGRTEVAVQLDRRETRTFDVQARDLRSQPDIQGVVLNARDVSERKKLEAQLRHQALHDPLTGLPNRRRFRQRYEAMPDAERELASVLFLDLDGFKLVNDSFGHHAGDELLRHVAERIGSCLSEGDVLARQGGDEFLILHVNADTGGGSRNGSELASSIGDVLQPPFVVAGKEVFVSASIGVVAQLEDLDAEQVAQRADIAMYEAKNAGKAQAVAFHDDMMAGASDRLTLESDFRKALERNEFTVVYQPKVGLTSERIESLEALVRWQHPERGFVSPDEFVPFAEESGLIAELGRNVLEQACRDAVRWQDSGVIVAVNLSPIQFRNPELVQEVSNALRETGLAPGRLELEITESAVLGDVQRTIEVLHKLKSLGCRLAIDDFGTGYSNLAHLKHFDVDVLKIDQAFVRGGNPSAQDHLSDGEIVKAVIGMAKAFDLHVVAEGVETKDHVDELRELGADLGQGYFFSKPVSGDQIDSMLAAEAH